jgi:hypothetical protein
MVPPLGLKADTTPQGINYKRNSELGSLLQILPSTIILHVKFSTMAPQRGLSKGTHIGNGRRTAAFSGFVVIVSFAHPFYLYDH